MRAAPEAATDVMDAAPNKAPGESFRATDDRQQSGEQEIKGDGAVDQYPTGLRQALLAGASIMGVFLISLDQVSRLVHTITIHPFLPINTSDRLLSEPPFRK